MCTGATCRPFLPCGLGAEGERCVRVKRSAPARKFARARSRPHKRQPCAHHAHARKPYQLQDVHAGRMIARTPARARGRTRIRSIARMPVPARRRVLNARTRARPCTRPDAAAPAPARSPPMCVRTRTHARTRIRLDDFAEPHPHPRVRKCPHRRCGSSGLATATGNPPRLPALPVPPPVRIRSRRCCTEDRVDCLGLGFLPLSLATAPALSRPLSNGCSPSPPLLHDEFTQSRSARGSGPRHWPCRCTRTRCR